MRSHKKLQTVLLSLLLIGTGSGCSFILGVTAGAVATVGYTVYQGGRLVVVGASEAADGVAYAFSDGALVTVCPAPLELVYNAALVTFHEMKFKNIDGKQDALSAELTAYSVKNERITLELEHHDNKSADFSLQIGEDGDLEKSQVIYERIIQVINDSRAQQEQQ